LVIFGVAESSTRKLSLLVPGSVIYFQETGKILRHLELVGWLKILLKTRQPSENLGKNGNRTALESRVKKEFWEDSISVWWCLRCGWW